MLVFFSRPKRDRTIKQRVKGGVKRITSKVSFWKKPNPPPTSAPSTSGIAISHTSSDPFFYPSSSASSSDSSIYLAFYRWMPGTLWREDVHDDGNGLRYEQDSSASSPSSYSTQTTDKSWLAHKPSSSVRSLRRKERRKILYNPYWKSAFPIMELPAELIPEILQWISIPTYIHLFFTTRYFRHLVAMKFAPWFENLGHYPLLHDFFSIAKALKHWAAKRSPELPKSKLVGWTMLLLLHVSCYLVTIGVIPPPQDIREKHDQFFKMETIKQWNKRLVSNPAEYFKTYFNFLHTSGGRQRHRNHGHTAEENSRLGTDLIESA
ncbi:hypothetical protein TWF694_007592 [Orbilia ellipsospora]|uniref:F-box domain-containing protein n=1 Tax=Orbilia ellipsospora TaxID=2528407 RepID=A0AAV9XJP9_9PEZI